MRAIRDLHLSLRARTEAHWKVHLSPGGGAPCAVQGASSVGCDSACTFSPASGVQHAPFVVHQASAAIAIATARKRPLLGL